MKYDKLTRLLILLYLRDEVRDGRNPNGPYMCLILKYDLGIYFISRIPELFAQKPSTSSYSWFGHNGIEMRLKAINEAIKLIENEQD